MPCLVNSTSNDHLVAWPKKHIKAPTKVKLSPRSSLDNQKYAQVCEFLQQKAVSPPANLVLYNAWDHAFV